MNRMNRSLDAAQNEMETKGGFIRNKERHHSWFEREDNIHGTPSPTNRARRTAGSLDVIPQQYLKDGVHDGGRSGNSEAVHRTVGPNDRKGTEDLL